VSGHATRHRTHCQNCRAELTGPYCAQCGQHDVDYTRSFGHIVEDSLEGMFHFDGKFFASARYIFIRPGFLTTEFLAGRRTRYANPLRFYIFASFLLFAFTVLTSRPPTPAEAAAAKAQADRQAQTAHAGATDTPKDHPFIKFTASKEDAGTSGFIRVDSLDSSKVASKTLSDEFWHRLPTILFFCLPVLALLLKLAYRGSRTPYIAHIIFALHLQALVFLCLILIKCGWLLAMLVGDETGRIVSRLLSLATALLVYGAFRHVYRQGWARTAIKLVLVGATYGVFLLLVFGGEVGISYYLLAHGTHP
jgi:hypothetical protein